MSKYRYGPVEINKARISGLPTRRTKQGAQKAYGPGCRSKYYKYVHQRRIVAPAAACLRLDSRNPQPHPYSLTYLLPVPECAGRGGGDY
eukprot:scaffold12316_cov113-Isochrysis_galbana.AAC.3